MRINEKIAALRNLMERQHVNTYIITKFDPHQSEYSSPHWNGVHFISGFSGSAGTVVVTEKEAGLWTDGRYYIQAERELSGSEIKLFKASEQNVPSFMSFAAKETPIGGAIGFDGRTLSREQAMKLIKKSGDKNITLKADSDLLAALWEDRPPISSKPVFIHDTKFCGKSRNGKITVLRAKMTEEGIGIYVLSSLDDIAWLLNLRGGDMPNETFFTAYAVITTDEALLFVEEGKMQTVRAVLEHDGIRMMGYGEIADYLQSADAKHTIALNPMKTCYALSKALEKNKIMDRKPDITSEMKAVKNGTERACLETTNIRDGVAMVRFMKWLKENVPLVSGQGGLPALTEWDIGCKLQELRGVGENYLSPSFTTIAAYMGNAAMMHYSAGPEGSAQVSDGLLLVDSGAHYLDGTTDITRTFVLGDISAQMKRDFTLVLKSHIALAKTVFLYGATGSNLDIMARMPMWLNGMDYKSGTGHGIGFCSSVHEGPQSISQKQNTVRLEPGMIITNEPGVYRENQYGIRTENTMCITEHSETEFGRFLAFQVISYCPIDLPGIDPTLLTEDEKAWLNSYHRTVYEKLAPSLEADEKSWLGDATAALA